VNSAGFRKVTVKADVKLIRFPSSEEYAKSLTMGAPAFTQAMDRLDGNAQNAVIEDLRADLEKYSDGDGLEIPHGSHILTGYA
jgi:hypothetical protein